MSPKAGGMLPARNILIFCTHGIGDVVTCLPMFRGLREAYPDAHIELLLRGPVQESILAGHGFRFAVTRLRDLRRSPRRLWATVVRWRRRRFDVVISTLNVHPWRALLLGLGAGAKTRIGFARGGGRVPFTHCLQGRGGHKVDENLRVLDVLGAAEASTAVRWPIGEHERRWAEKTLTAEGLGSKPLLGLAPGCTPHEAHKRWPAERYAELVRRLRTRLEFDLALFGGPAEKHLAAPLEDVGEGETLVLNAIGRMSLRQTAACMARCRLVIGGDSGLAHVADATGTATLVLFGPTDPKITAPRGEQTTIIQSTHECVGCYERRLRIPASCPLPRCMHAIPVEQVADAAEHIWKEAARTDHAPAACKSPAREATSSRSI